MQTRFPHFYVAPKDAGLEALTEKWRSEAYNADIEVVRPVAEIDGVENRFVRASRQNGTDRAGWEDFVTDYKD